MKSKPETIGSKIGEALKTPKGIFVAVFLAFVAGILFSPVNIKDNSRLKNTLSNKASITPVPSSSSGPSSEDALILGLSPTAPEPKITLTPTPALSASSSTTSAYDYQNTEIANNIVNSVFGIINTALSGTFNLVNNFADLPLSIINNAQGREQARNKIVQNRQGLIQIWFGYFRKDWSNNSRKLPARKVSN